MKRNKLVLFLFFAACFFAACENLEDLNENPNSPTEVPVERLFQGVERDLSNNYVTNSFDLTTKYVLYTEWPSKLWDEHLLNRQSGEDWWFAHFNEVSNIDYVLEHTTEAGYENYRGVALTIKSWMYYLLTNFYGDVPYSQAGKAAEGVNKPSYDTQEEVYQGILADLEEANNLLGTGSVPLNGDIILSNDAMLWKKFANSLRVRVLISQAKQVDPSAKLQEIIDNPSIYPLLDNYMEQPAFTYNAEITYPRSVGGLFFVGGTFMTEDFINKLLDNDDERIKVFAGRVANPTLPTYIGIPDGENVDPVADNVSRVSSLVLNSREIFALQSVWMHHSELMFLLAEAAEKGWISGGTGMAKSYYEQGVASSYNYQKSRLDIGIAEGSTIPPMAPWSDNYLSHAGVSYEGTTQQKIERIAEQKWIALFSDMESYFSWKRTGLPTLNFNPNGPNGGQMPLRFKYPTNERVFNTENYDAAVARQGADEWSTKMWILQ